jgi:FdhD protein
MGKTLERDALTQASVARLADGGREVCDDRVAVEAPVAFLYNLESYIVLMASPSDLEDFAYGFSIAEGVVAGADEIKSVRTGPNGAGMTVSIEVPEARAEVLGARKRNLEGRTGCGLCGLVDIEEVLRELPALPATRAVSAAALLDALAALPGQQALNQETGAVHAAAFAGRDGSLLCVREDVGRHNALDKLIGAAARQGLDPRDGFIIITSRCSMEMVQKTATFGCPILVAISAPTSLAIELADKSNLTIAAFARGDRLSLYTHPERVA